MSRGVGHGDTNQPRFSYTEKAERAYVRGLPGGAIASETGGWSQTTIGAETQRGYSERTIVPQIANDAEIIVHSAMLERLPPGRYVDASEQPVSDHVHVNRETLERLSDLSRRGIGGQPTTVIVETFASESRTSRLYRDGDAFESTSSLNFQRVSVEVAIDADRTYRLSKFDWEPGSPQSLNNQVDAVTIEARAAAAESKEMRKPMEGSHTVRFTDGAAQTVVHELVGHVLEDDTFIKLQRSNVISQGVYYPALGRVTVKDVGSRPHPWTSAVNATAYGERLSDTVLAKDGVIMQTIGRATPASPLGTDSRGLRRSKPSNQALARMRHLSIEAEGALPFEDDDIFTVQTISSAMFSPATRKATFRLGRSTVNGVAYYGGKVEIELERFLQLAYFVEPQKSSLLFPQLCFKEGQFARTLVETPDLVMPAAKLGL